MRVAVDKMWPEIQWIQDAMLREQVTQTWVKALERSPLKPDDLNYIPFTLLVPHCPITFMEHKRCVVHIACKSAAAMKEFMGRALPVDIDTVIAGAIGPMWGSFWNMRLAPTARPAKVSEGRRCVIRLPE